MQRRIFPESADKSGTLTGPVYVLVTFQPSKADLIDWGDEAAREKDLLLKNVRIAIAGIHHHDGGGDDDVDGEECGLLMNPPSTAMKQFVAWGKVVCEHLRRSGHWADMSDPCSGYPVERIPRSLHAMRG